MTSTDKYGLCCGGELDTMEHLPLRFPSEMERRKVCVHIYTYSGLSYGATHWHADVEEEDNCFVDHEKEMFLQPWSVREHDHLVGRLWTESCITKIEAEQMVRDILIKHFLPETHYVFVAHDDQGDIYEELGYRVITMYANEARTSTELARQRLAAQYKTTEGRGG